MKKLHRVSRQHRVALVGGDADKSFVDDPARFRPIASRMGKVAPPQQCFNADVVTQPNTERIFHEPPAIALAQILTWLALERLHTPIALCPVAIALVVIVDLRETVRQPADLSLGPVDA